MKKTLKKVLTFVLGCMVLCSAFPTFAKEDVVASTKEYQIEISDASCVYFGNEKKVDFELGKKYCLTYTVDKVVNNETVQSGMALTTNPDQNYPYVDGTMQYDTKSLLMQEGHTYFLRFEMTKDGMQYIAAVAKDEKNNYIQLPADYAGTVPKSGYFGVWTGEGGTLTASLSHVRCYDEDGNDLGVYGSSARGVMVIAEGLLDQNVKLEHSYEFSLKDAKTVAVSNSRRTVSNVVYMEYTVKNVKPIGVTQSGVVNTTMPANTYPHGPSRGLLRYNYHAKPEECKMLTEGASYVVRFEKTDSDFSTMIKRIINGKEDYISCTLWDGDFSDGGYFSLWFGESCQLTADFVNVKCYDGDGNNLAIQTNQGVSITHIGNLEDYSQCEAVYYCKGNNTFITLDDECHASKWMNGEKTANVGTYYINNSKLYLTIGEEQEEFDYVFESFTDGSDNKYLRLRDTKVRFISGVIGGEQLEEVTVTAKDGYKVDKPSEPKKKGNTFKGWCLGDGTEYDFDEVVTEALTLYAKWQDGDGNEYLATEVSGSMISTPTFVIGLCVLLIICTVIAGVLIVKKGKKNESKH